MRNRFILREVKKVFQLELDIVVFTFSLLKVFMYLFFINFALTNSYFSSKFCNSTLIVPSLDNYLLIVVPLLYYSTTAKHSVGIACLLPSPLLLLLRSTKSRGRSGISSEKYAGRFNERRQAKGNRTNIEAAARAEHEHSGINRSDRSVFIFT